MRAFVELRRLRLTQLVAFLLYLQRKTVQLLCSLLYRSGALVIFLSCLNYAKDNHTMRILRTHILRTFLGRSDSKQAHLSSLTQKSARSKRWSAFSEMKSVASYGRSSRNPSVIRIYFLSHRRKPPYSISLAIRTKSSSNYRTLATECEEAICNGCDYAGYGRWFGDC